jgi:hypothetical protein
MPGSAACCKADADRSVIQLQETIQHRRKWRNGYGKEGRRGAPKVQSLARTISRSSKPCFSSRTTPLTLLNSSELPFSTAIAGLDPGRCRPNSMETPSRNRCAGGSKCGVKIDAHDPEKWTPVFPRDISGTRLRGAHALIDEHDSTQLKRAREAKIPGIFVNLAEPESA